MSKLRGMKILREHFESNRYPKKEEIKRLKELTSFGERNIYQWFSKERFLSKKNRIYQQQ